MFCDLPCNVQYKIWRYHFSRHVVTLVAACTRHPWTRMARDDEEFYAQHSGGLLVDDLVVLRRGPSWHEYAVLQCCVRWRLSRDVVEDRDGSYLESPGIHAIVDDVGCTDAVLAVVCRDMDFVAESLQKHLSCVRITVMVASVFGKSYPTVMRWSNNNCCMGTAFHTFQKLLT